MSREREAYDLLCKAKDGDPHAAVELLAIAADCLKSREPISGPLADHLAGAFQRAVSTTQPANGERIEHARIAALAKGLCLTREPKRPRKGISRLKLLCMIAGRSPLISESQLCADVAREFGVSRSSARRQINEVYERMERSRRRDNAPTTPLRIRTPSIRRQHAPQDA